MYISPQEMNRADEARHQQQRADQIQRMNGDWSFCAAVHARAAPIAARLPIANAVLAFRAGLHMDSLARVLVAAIEIYETFNGVDGVWSDAPKLIELGR